MKKILLVLLALSLSFGQVCFADVQIDAGQSKDDNAIKFFVARNGREAVISADRVVVWDSTSKDGLTVSTTTTSGDRLVAGITLDSIPGVSSDSVTEDMSSNNWGRVQTWGSHDNVLTAAGVNLGTAGLKMCTSGTAGAASGCVSSDAYTVGVALEAVTGAVATVDIMVQAD